MGNKVIAIVGSTATGKTNLAIQLAKKIDGEIINCDSRQVYSMMNIGTNKGKVKRNNQFVEFERKKVYSFDIENSGVNGWLFDIVEPNEQLTLADYQKLTLFMIERIKEKGKVPILVGGTGLYFDALIKGYKLNEIKPNLQLRLELAKYSVDGLLKRLLQVDKKRADNLNNSDIHNPRRLIRAIEEAEAMQEAGLKNDNIQIVLEKRGNLNDSKFDKGLQNNLNPYIIYPNIDREELYRKLDERVLSMVAEGLVQETTKVIEEYDENLEVLKGIGYKEVIAYLHEKITLSEMIALIQQGHKNYAKRQVTWFEGSGRNYELHYYHFQKDTETIFQDTQRFLGR